MKRRTFFKSSLAAAAVASLPRTRPLSALYRSVPQDPPDLNAVTGDGGQVTIPGSDVAELAAKMRGRVLLPDDDGYDEARRILNVSFDKYPALVVQPTGTADVRTAVEFASAFGLLTAVKCGGHSLSGKSTCDRGLQIDLSAHRDVHIDPAARRARVTGGSLLGALDHEAMSHGLVTTMGTVSHTGVGGLVTGGGFGRVGRRFGLAIDNLRSVDVVTADGQVVHANAEQNRDLFWGVRGGSGNFGIVTSFEFELHPMQREVVAGTIVYPRERARDVLGVFSEYSLEAPDELDSGFFVGHPPGEEPPACGFYVCWSGPAADAERAIAPYRSLGSPIADQVQAMDYVAVQKSGDIDDPRARASYVKSGFIPSMPAGLIDAIVDGLDGDPRRNTAVFYQQSGGAISRVANDATAFAFRDAIGNLLSAVDWPHGEDPTDHVAWIKDYWAAIEPYTQGFYVNDLELETTAADVNANYRGNYPRLVEIKNRYDPDNLFRLNANILPTV